jgi:hypothetical protein
LFWCALGRGGRKKDERGKGREEKIKKCMKEMRRHEERKGDTN